MLHLQGSKCDVLIKRNNKIITWAEDIIDITSGTILLPNGLYMPTYNLHRLNSRTFIFAYYVDIETVSDIRQWLIDRIEGMIGTLSSVPYHLISTDDLIKWYNAII